jgi:LPXTG-motif cell wall-anchored protein
MLVLVWAAMALLGLVILLLLLRRRKNEPEADESAQ